jgi:hypothetical protein
MLERGQIVTWIVSRVEIDGDVPYPESTGVRDDDIVAFVAVVIRGDLHLLVGQGADRGRLQVRVEEESGEDTHDQRDEESADVLPHLVTSPVTGSHISTICVPPSM